jgi:hypothetical protein
MVLHTAKETAISSEGRKVVHSCSKDKKMKATSTSSSTSYRILKFPFSATTFLFTCLQLPLLVVVDSIKFSTERQNCCDSLKLPRIWGTKQLFFLWRINCCQSHQIYFFTPTRLTDDSISFLRELRPLSIQFLSGHEAFESV